MAESSFTCSVRQGFNFEKDQQVTVGFVNTLKVSTAELAPDITVTDPEKVKDGQLTVVGVLSSIYWSGGYSDPVQMSMQVSEKNQKEISVLVHMEMSDTEVEVDFCVYDYDFTLKVYYKSFHCEAVKLKGLIYKSGGELAMRVSAVNDPSQEVVSPKNFAFTLGIMPAEIEQAIHLAVGSDKKFAKRFGVKVGG